MGSIGKRPTPSALAPGAAADRSQRCSPRGAAPPGWTSGGATWRISIRYCSVILRMGRNQEVVRMDIGVIGSGNVGRTLAAGLAGAGHAVRLGSR
ncbi:MAG: NAD(P)-binding domain-containing protein, partial [Acidimicrobiia bacterium]